jgi:hypothetical protein
MNSVDACFLCRQSSRSRVCGHCSVRAHSKCWATFLEHGTTSLGMTNRRCVKCPQCAEKIVIESQYTRSVAESVRVRSNFIKTVKERLLSIKGESSRPGKERLAGELFEYICQNVTVISKCSQLLVMIEQKLQSLYASGWDQAMIFHDRLFRQTV